MSADGVYIAALALLALGSVLVLGWVWTHDDAPQGFVKEGRRWR